MDTAVNNTTAWTNVTMGDNCTTSANTSCVHYAAEEEEELVDLSPYIVPPIFAVIFIVGIIGNGTLVFIVVRNKVMHTTPNILIVSLAVGDLLLLLVSVPFYAVSYSYPSWPFGQFLCKLNGFLKALSLGVSVFTMTALSADRYSAIMFPMQRHAESPMRRTLLITGAIWGLASTFAILEGSVIHVSEYPWAGGMTFRVCHSHPEHWGTWFKCFRANLRFLIYFLVPLLVIGVLYSLMARSLWLSQSTICTTEGPPLRGQGQGAAAARQAEARKKVAKLVLFLVLLFFVSWLPMHVYFLWFHCPSAGHFNMFWHVWKISSYCLSFSNSCVNPLALYILSDQFRRFFAWYLCCGWRRPGGGRGGQPPGASQQWQTTAYRSHSELSSDIVHTGPTSRTFM